ncbi:MAG: carbamate kinase [Tissierellia bacterium]|nr:carbamate kinase [Tissierellia bacterium]
MEEKVVIALGGNALGHSPEEQRAAVVYTSKSIADLVESGARVTICHGNGPQVGMIKKAMDTATNADESIPMMPFPECGAMSEGYIGYHLQSALHNELKSRNLDINVVSLVTQVLVDANDQSFNNPTKPIGNFMSKEEADKLAEKGISVVEDSGRGYRQVVASPMPVDIIEGQAIKKLVESGVVVIAGGGGGIPVVYQDGALVGVDAVIDKDSTSVRIAQTIDADKLIILTAVDKVAINFGKPDEKWLDKLTVDEARNYIQSKEFAEGSMLPKIKAAVDFAESKEGRKTLITSLEKAGDGLKGKTGTWIVK